MAKSLTKIPLPRPGDPLIMPTGEALTPDLPPHEVRALIRETQKETDPARFRASTVRNIRDMPAPPKAMNAVAVIFVYTVMGLSDSEIAEQMGLHPDQVRAVRNSPAYAAVYEATTTEFVSASADNLRSRIAAYGHLALNKMVEIMYSSESEKNRISTAKDILDRAGARPVDLQEQRKRENDGLSIVVLEAEKEIEAPMDFDVPDLPGNSQPIEDEDGYHTGH